MSVIEGAAKLDADLVDVGVAQRAVAVQFAQRPPLDVLGDQQGLIGFFTDLEDREDVVLAELGRSLSLPQDAPLDVGRAGDDLDGDRPPHDHVVGEVHGGEGPAAQLADDPVAVVEEGGLNHAASISPAPDEALPFTGSACPATPGLISCP